MNQTLKDCIYSKGTDRQLAFLAELGGMNEEEIKAFTMFHNGEKDRYIMSKLLLDEKPFKKLERSVRDKLIIAVFECIHIAMQTLNFQ